MSEKSLDNLIRQLRQVESSLRYAEDIGDKLLQNHTVAAAIHLPLVDVQRYRKFLDTEYRASHFARGRRG